MHSNPSITLTPNGAPPWPYSRVVHHRIHGQDEKHLTRKCSGRLSAATDLPVSFPLTLSFHNIHFFTMLPGINL